MPRRARARRLPEASCPYQCEQCGHQEPLPAEVLAFFDAVDPGEPDAPATFRCERCPGIMYPEWWLRAKRAAP